MMNKTFSASLAAILLLATTSARADDRVSVGAFLGTHIFSQKLELGAFDTASDSPSNSIAFGVRAGYRLLAKLSLEGELAIMPTHTRLSDDELTVIAGRLQGRWDLVPDERMRPFVTAGVGVLALSTTNAAVLEEDSDLTSHLGLGLEYDLNPTWAVRADLHALFAPTTDGRYLTTDMEFFVGISQQFPRHSFIAPADSDGDGVFDPQDRCVDEPEDQDGYDDEDGCPDPDNDGDGVPDVRDECPAEAESPNGIDDDDGCPEADGDGDGIVGSRDLCPQEAEDFDGVEDEDGCPDADPAPVPLD